MIKAENRPGRIYGSVFCKERNTLCSGSFNKFVTAFWAGDLDLSFSFRNTDSRTALAAAKKFVRIPLFPALFRNSEKAFYFIDLLQEPQPFL